MPSPRQVSTAEMLANPRLAFEDAAARFNSLATSGSKRVYEGETFRFDDSERFANMDAMLARFPELLDNVTEGIPPLAWAGWKGQAPVVDFLLQKGANPFTRATRGLFTDKTPREIVIDIAQDDTKGRKGRLMNIASRLEQAEQEWVSAGKPVGKFSAAVRSDEAATQQMPDTSPPGAVR